MCSFNGAALLLNLRGSSSNRACSSFHLLYYCVIGHFTQFQRATYYLRLFLPVMVDRWRGPKFTLHALLNIELILMKSNNILEVLKFQTTLS